MLWSPRGTDILRDGAHALLTIDQVAALSEVWVAGNPEASTGVSLSFSLSPSDCAW